jgi:putative ABC transport system ATP-binding protein
MTAPPTFELNEVVAGPSARPIIRSMTVNIPCRGITVVTGPSGSGKSTLLRLLNRLDDPTAGTIRLEGRPLTDWDPSTLRRHVAMVFQRAPLFPGTVEDNFRVALADVTTERAQHVLGHVGLEPELLDRLAVDLSGGEAQRMCIARALLTEPTVLLADELTAALDGAARQTVEDLGRLVADSGVPIVWVSHDTAQLRRLADHVLVIIDGQVGAFGHLEDLDSDPDPQIRELVGAS